MNYILFNKNLPVYVTSLSPFTGTTQYREVFDKFGDQVIYDEVKSSGDYKSWEEVEELATRLTVLTGETWLPFDDGDSTSHRFGVFEPPKVGDDVSYGFNGDYYPCGKVVRITPGWRIYTSDDNKPEGARRKVIMFNRRGRTSRWIMKGGTWALVPGIRNERNPSF